MTTSDQGRAQACRDGDIGAPLERQHKDPMEYRVLARKYRPQNFHDLIGQEVLVRTLSNAFAMQRVAHALLLTGIRGVGKTTTARIIARALNCVGVDGMQGMTTQPCGICTHCVGISEGRHMDVLEMDAASHTGVDDIRDIITTVQYLPGSARTKVYIIDEVHMLSNNAFNALLKTLEEPPPHVKFIFATTEIRKIPVTILSRCQRFDLKRIDTATLVQHLRRIGEREAVTAEDEALHLLALAAEGSVRDALSLFDQAIAHSAQEENSQVTASAVRDMLGMKDKSQLFAWLEQMVSGQVAESVQSFRGLHEAGGDPLLLLQEMLTLIHFISRVKLAPLPEDDKSFSVEERELAQKFAGQLSVPVLSRLWQMLLKGLQEAKAAPDPVIATEMLLIRLGFSADLPTPAEVIRRLQRGEAEGAREVSPAPRLSMEPAHAPVVSLITSHQAPAPAILAQSAPEMLLASFEDAVQLFQEKREPLLYHYLTRQVRLVRFEDGRIDLHSLPGSEANAPGRVAQCLSDWTGRRWLVALSSDAGGPTLAERQGQKDAALKQAALDHPLVQQVLQHFPGAEITALTTKEDPK